MSDCRLVFAKEVIGNAALTRLAIVTQTIISFDINCPSGPQILELNVPYRSGVRKKRLNLLNWDLLFDHNRRVPLSPQSLLAST